MSTPDHRATLRRLLIAQVPADFADWLDFVAIGALLAFVWTVPPYVFAVLAVSMGLPYLLIGPFAGVWVDRSNLNRVLLLSNLGRAICTAALFLAPHWPVLMVFIALRASCDTFFTPAKQAAIQALTDDDTRMRANGHSHAINQVSKIAAPALGGTLLIWLAPQQIFLINALVSLIAVLMVWRLPPIQRDVDETPEPTGMMQNIRAGIAEIAGKPILRATLIMMAIGYFAMFFYDTLIAPLTRDLGFSETALGLSLAAVGAGSVLGALVLGETKYPFRWIAAGAGVASLLTIALGVAEVLGMPITLPLYLGLFFGLGVASAINLVPFRTLIQTHTAPDRIGRVTALSEAINTIALLTAPFMGAAIAAATSFGMAFICGGALMFVVALRALALQARH
ncbi:MFS transporter [Cognatiyoonia sp. IB215446]|uniref:MFS transporter n=1 Tax=Cognatiyoonia sp. IB215446 TaxID=3097355 RepID=UPI002A0C7C1D|nr:MFS transporter [Cognatiyoonia sp. IB215446]MDX8348301.1 MFS transporter [Cognatiyoonia sp. IB215446]